MLKLSEKTAIFSLLEAKFPIAEISKKTGKSLGTIYKYKEIYENRKKNTELEPEKNNISSKLALFKEFLDLQLKNGITNSAKLYQDILQKGYSGSYPLLNSYVRKYSPQKNLYRLT